jgi:hypothetical protein
MGKLMHQNAKHPDRIVNDRRDQDLMGVGQQKPWQTNAHRRHGSWQTGRYCWESHKQPE